MKKMNGMETLSIQEQTAITHWYTHTQYILAALSVILIVCTASSCYYYKTCTQHCEARISPTLHTQHASHAKQQQYQQVCTTERTKGIELLQNYARILSHHAQDHTPTKLVDLRLTPHHIISVNTVNNHRTIQTYIDQLRQLPELNQIHMESIEQQPTSPHAWTCTVKATWKK